VRKTIVVTGARGFVGAAVIRKLSLVRDATVVAVARTRPDVRTDADIHWVEKSLEELEPSTWQSAETREIDAVVHLAAFTPKNSAERDRAGQIISANVVGTQALLRSLPQPPRRLIFCSTLDVYSPRAFDNVVDEKAPLGPLGLYGLSKLFGEGLVESYARSAGIEHVTLRLGHVFGPSEERYAKLVPETIRRVLAGKPPCIAGDGNDKRDLLYVDDAAEAIARSCFAALGDVHTINIARGESHSILEIATTIAAVAGRSGPIETIPRSSDAHSTSFDVSLMRQVLGTWPFVSLAEGLKREVEWFREHA
jgi:nucleoside-diphosphate-sugar epimerase